MTQNSFCIYVYVSPIPLAYTIRAVSGYQRLLGVMNGCQVRRSMWWSPMVRAVGSAGRGTERVKWLI